MVLLTGRHELDEVVGADGAVDNLEVCDDAAERIEYRVEYQCLQRCLGVAFGSGHALDDGAENLGDADACLARRTDDFLTLAADQVDDFVLHFLGIGRVEIHLVYNGDDLEVVVDGHVQVGDGLGLHALRSVDYQERAFACGDGARHLVGEVDVSRSVDKVEDILLSVKLVLHLYGVALDGDASFALEIHVVEHLSLHILGGHSVGIFKQTVGQGRFAVVDVRYYAEIADILHLGEIFAKLRKKLYIRGLAATIQAA